MSKEEKRAQMFAMIADWQQSGMSKKRYCEENGINEAAFYYWFSRS
ncbi:IS66 family insertion sequence element accessory protein TnpA [Sphingobacterium suaedae]